MREPELCILVSGGPADRRKGPVFILNYVWGKWVAGDQILPGRVDEQELMCVLLLGPFSDGNKTRRRHLLKVIA